MIQRTRTPRFESLESRRLLASISVNTAIDETTNPATTSLREAIAFVNGQLSTSVVHSINFTGAAVNGMLTINSPLPTITKPVRIEVDALASSTARFTIARGTSWTGADARGLALDIATGSTGLQMRIQGIKVLGFLGDSSHGLSVTDLPAQTSLTIADCTFDNNGGNGINIDVPLPTSGADEYGSLSITNNVITKNAVGIRLNNYDVIFTGTFGITGNLIGTTGTSTTDGNRSYGVHISNSATSATATNAGIAGNTISNNGDDGLFLDKSIFTNAFIGSANKIGLTSSGTSALGNAGDGIRLRQSRTTIQFNDIGGNLGDGINLENSPFTIVQNNGIGTSRTNSTLDLGNTGSGIALNTLATSTSPFESRDIKIASNFISFNNNNGVVVNGLLADRNEITQNQFRDNTVGLNAGLPIDLVGVIGQDPYDQNDTDTGPNDRMNYPILLVGQATMSAGTWSIPYSFDVDQPGEYRLEIYKYTEGSPGGPLRRYAYVTFATPNDVTANSASTYEGMLSIPNGAGTANVQAGDRLAALAIRTGPASGTNLLNTSEMSPPTPALINADTTPPHITNVLINGLQPGTALNWSLSTIRSFRDLVGVGQQLRPIAIAGANRIQIEFSENVKKRSPSNQPIDLDGSELVLYRTVRQQAPNNDPSVTPYTSAISTQQVAIVANGFSYDPGSRIATWTFPTLADGKYAIHLASDAPHAGVYGVTDAAGNALDSTWNSWANRDNGTPDYWQDDPAATFADGDGTPGSSSGNRFRFHFAILVGDYDGNGVVNSADVTVSNDFGTDGDGNGIINPPNTGADHAIKTAGLHNLLPLKGLGGSDFIFTDGREDDYVSITDLTVWKNAFGMTANGDSTGDGQSSGNDMLAWQTALGNRSVWNLAGPAPGFSIPASPSELPVPGLPKVMNVIISGSQSQHAPFLFDAVAGSGQQLATVPVGGADTISIVFNEPVNVAADNLVVIGLRTANLPELAQFTYNPLTYTGTWRFEGWSLADQYLLVVSDDVTDVDGNALDGEWTNPATTTTTNLAVSEFPSGNDQPGGWFKFVMTLLPGDANLDGVVGTIDYAILSGNWGAAIEQLFTHGDFNGDGAVNGLDFSLLANFYTFDFRSIFILGDLNNDLSVDEGDFGIINSNFGMTGASRSDGDIDGDGIVTLADLEIAFAQFGANFNAVF